MKTSFFCRLPILLVTTLLCWLSSCNNYLDVNTDPNNAATAQVNLLLPSAQAAISFSVGNDLQIKGSIWAQYWTQNPAASQYRVLEQYSPGADEFNTTWTILNASALADLQKVIELGRAGNQSQYVAIALLLKAYTFQLLTDLYGDIPFSQALQGDNPQNPVLNPAYDRQEVIYNGLVALVDEGIALIDVNNPNHPGTDDLIYQGDMGRWLHFAYTLKLKIGLRLSEVAPDRAAAIVGTLSGKPFPEEGESAQIAYYSGGGSQNPLYSAIAGPVLNRTQNLVASFTAISYLNASGDPRIEAFYQPASNGQYVGIPQGGYASVTPGSPIAYPSAKVGADANDPASALAPVKLLTDYESAFLQAEATARGWLSGAGTAEDLYNQGITSSFVAYGIDLTQAELEGFLSEEGIAYPKDGPLSAQLEAILTQKWIAMNGNQGIEAWIEWRRTGYPSFFTPSAASNIGQGRYPTAFLYPSTETTRNPNNPGQRRIFDRVWWDVR
jgi:hypothetical protein